MLRVIQLDEWCDVGNIIIRLYPKKVSRIDNPTYLVHFAQAVAVSCDASACRMYPNVIRAAAKTMNPAI